MDRLLKSLGPQQISDVLPDVLSAGSPKYRWEPGLTR
jgi:hypothetical protein